jgi:hypothetical protein
MSRSVRLCVNQAHLPYTFLVVPRAARNRRVFHFRMQSIPCLHEGARFSLYLIMRKPVRKSITRETSLFRKQRHVKFKSGVAQTCIMPSLFRVSTINI